MFRPRAESHRSGGRPDGLEHLRDLRTNWQIEPHGEVAREFRTSMFHRHSPRCRLRITGIDQPCSIAVKDRQHCVKHIAHHLLEVIRPLDSSVDLIHALQEPEMGLTLFFRPFAFGHVHGGTDELNNIAGRVEHRMAYSEEVFYLAALKNGSEIHLKLRPFTDCSFEDFEGSGSILRMNALNNCFEWRYALFRIDAVHTVEFL